MPASLQKDRTLCRDAKRSCEKRHETLLGRFCEIFLSLMFLSSLTRTNRKMEDRNIFEQSLVPLMNLINCPQVLRRRCDGSVR
jgi:hypothetical protein